MLLNGSRSHKMKLSIFYFSLWTERRSNRTPDLLHVKRESCVLTWCPKGRSHQERTWRACEVAQPPPPPSTLTDKNTVHPSSIWIVPVRMLTFNLKANRNYCHISYVRPYCSRQFASYSRKRHVAWRSKNVEMKVQNPERLVLVLHIKIL
jgi:hypothetical protein